MIPIARLLTASTAVLALGFGIASAQPPANRGMNMPRYDKATETTIAGTVQEVKMHQGRMGRMMTGTHLLLKTADGTIDVHVGPTNWLTAQKYEFAAGDQLQVLGSKVKIDGADALIAREITKGSTTMVLRSENGMPKWAGGAARRP